MNKRVALRWCSRGGAPLIAAAVAMSACGTPATSTTPDSVALPKSKPAALREFAAGVRAMRLRGPEAAEHAKPRFQAAAKLDTHMWEAHHNVGAIEYESGNGRAAAGAYSDALNINPNSYESLLGRAEARRMVGNKAGAAKDYRRAIAMRPTERDSYVRLASLLRQSKDYDSALSTLRGALRQAGEDSSLFVELAQIYTATGRDELAELVLTRAVKLDAKNPAVHNAMALIQLQRGRDQLAFDLFEQAAALDRTFVDARWNMASVLLDAGDYNRAAKELKKIVKQSPEDWDAHVALAIAYRGIKKYARAQKIWERVAKDAQNRRPRDDAMYNLAVLEMDIKMNEGAAKNAFARYLKESATGHPKRKDAKRRLSELGQ